MEDGNLYQAGYKVMFEPRVFFLLITVFLLVALVSIAVLTFKKSRKQKLENPKHRMLEDD